MPVAAFLAVPQSIAWMGLRPVTTVCVCEGELFGGPADTGGAALSAVPSSLGLRSVSVARIWTA